MTNPTISTLPIENLCKSKKRTISDRFTNSIFNDITFVITFYIN